ncbi:putative enzyme related to lactoylglutathione lyase [Catenulispora sp. GP43]|uniref:VOC family protein n=1 Tax=Catenulispora sp. GP43 TaxID=3156263 RepID=UPI003514453C
MKPTEAAIGAPCWVELGTADVPQAGEFYSALFDWTVATDPRAETGGYTTASLAGVPVAAISPLYAPGQLVAWSVSFAVLDSDATASRAAEEGGAVLMAPMDIFDNGRFAVLRDPGGAMFSVWQPRGFQGFGLWDEPGAACWVELATRDVPTATAFYQGLLGWSASSGDYPHLSAGGRQFGGLRDMNAMGVPEDVPTHWLVHFKAPDVAATAARAQALGAQTLSGPFHLPGTGYFATLRDPQGAVFAVYQAEDEDAAVA